MKPFLFPLSLIVGFAGLSLAQDKPVSVSGIVEPSQLVEIFPSTTGTVQVVNIGETAKSTDIGAVVKKGDVLAKLDDRLQQTDLQQAKAELSKAEAGVKLAMAKMSLAERDFERAKQGAALNTISKQELDLAVGALEIAKATIKIEEASVESSKAAVTRAQIMLDACTLRSPIDGTVINQRCTVGQTVGRAGESPLFVIADLATMRVVASVVEANLTKLAKGQTATISVHAFPDNSFQGKVGRLRFVPKAGQTPAGFVVEIEVDNRDGKLMPYLTANVKIESGPR